MSSHQSSVSGGDQQLMFDQKKRKRMLSNRESARRSRMRKQQHLDELLNQVVQLKDDNSQILMQINLLTEKYLLVESENTILRIQVRELTERLLSANSMLPCMKEIGAMSMAIPEVPDQLLEPWQLPCPAQRIMASVNMFQY